MSDSDLYTFSIHHTESPHFIAKIEAKHSGRSCKVITQDQKIKVTPMNVSPAVVVGLIHMLWRYLDATRGLRFPQEPISIKYAARNKSYQSLEWDDIYTYPGWEVELTIPETLA